MLDKNDEITSAKTRRRRQFKEIEIRQNLHRALSSLIIIY